MSLISSTSRQSDTPCWTCLDMLLTFCDTRFIQRDDSIPRFAERFSDVLSGLQEIVEVVNMDAKTKAKALSLLSSVSSSSFLVSLSAAKKVMSLTYTLSNCLQSPMLDLSDGTEMACSIIEHLQRWWLRLSSISQFDRIKSTLNLIYELVGK